MDDRGPGRRTDLEPDEVALDRLLGAAPPAALPLGFRDDILVRISADRSRSWEWIVAAAFALPSLAYIAWQIGVYGVDPIATLGDLTLIAETADSDASALLVDGLDILAMAILGLASIIAAHALMTTRSERMRVIR